MGFGVHGGLPGEAAILDDWDKGCDRFLGIVLPGRPRSDQITYAAGRGGIFVAAAGNSGLDTDFAPSYPSAYPNDNILAVAATDDAGALAAFSNYGARSVDVGAPGVDVTSTVPGAGYATWSGTSMAAPHVTGAVALVLAEHPDWTYRQVIDRIEGTVTPAATLTGRMATGGIINAGRALAAAPSLASFAGTDAATRGDWQGAYGSDGLDVIADAASYPAYAAVSASGQKPCTWAATTSDARALQRGGPGETGRVAATWFGGLFTVDLNLTDGQAHRVSLYAVDWDSTARQERVDVVDPASGAVLDSRAIASFHGGAYLTWNLSGHVQLRITRLAGANAVPSGLFFDPTA